MPEQLITQVKNPNEEASSSIGTSNTTVKKKKSLLSKIFPCFSSNSSDGNQKSSKNAKSPASGRSTNNGKSQPSSKANSSDSNRSNLPNNTSSPPHEHSKKGVPKSRHLLPALAQEDSGKKCLVLDLDETLVHSSFKSVPNADFVIPVEIDGQTHSVYVLKRPGVDTFLEKLCPHFETVVFTASLAKYADPVMDALDKTRVVKHRLFRESCIHHRGNYVKDLSLLGRDLKSVIIIDNAPASYMFHPSNAIPITSWFNDPSDTELLDLIPFLEDLRMVDDVTTVLDHTND